MDSNFIVSLIPTNFETVVKDYVKHWDDHINWVRQTLDQIKLDADNANKTPQSKIKSTIKKKRSTTRSQYISRPSASILNSVMADKSARITRSTSRFLKQHNMINEDGNLIKLNKNEVLKVLDENKTDPKKTKEINGKKVSFDSLNSDKNKKDENKEIDNNSEINKKEDDESIDKENKDSNINDNDKNSINKIDHNNENSESIDKQVKISNEEEKPKEIVNKKFEQLHQQDQQMECSPIKIKTLPNNILVDLTTPNNKTLPQQIEDEWITDDESISIKQKSTKSSVKSKNENVKNIGKSNLLTPSARVGIKRSATLKSATKPLVETKRNKTNEFATPKSLKKFYKPLQLGSASKKITRIPTVITNSKSATTYNKVNSNFGSKINKPDDHHLDAASHLSNQHQATNNRYLVPPTSSASSSICSNSQGSLKSGLTGLQQTSGKTLVQNNSTNSTENKKTICFGESALKQRLKEEERRKLLESKIEKENEAKLKKDKLLQQRALQTKTKREERERRMKEGKLLHDTEAEQKRIAEQKKLDELKKQLEIKQKAEEAAKKLAEIQKMEEARKRAEEAAREELQRKKEEEELKRKKEEEELRFKKEEESKKEQQRLRELHLKEKQATVTKKVQIKIDNDEEDDDLQTKLFNKIEKEIKKDEMKCKNTPLKQLVVKAVGKTNAEKSLYKPEIDPSLDPVNISLDLSNCDFSSDEEPQNTTTNNTFIKDFNNKETLLSSTFIKPPANVNNFNKTMVIDKKQEDKKQLIEEPIEEEELVLDNYDISELRSSDDDDDEGQTIPKRIPDWAKNNNFLKSVKDQFSCGIRERENKIKSIFSSIESTVHLQDVFKESERFVAKKYERRTSSACWSSPPATYIDSSFSKFY